MSHDKELVLVDKPKGITSFDVIRILRKKFGKEWGTNKMGHAGTLDPRATGLLLIGVGNGTKKLADLIGLSKVYEAEIVLGFETDSGDVEGKTIKEMPVPLLSPEKVEEIVLSMKGENTLPVSLYSAIKKDGKPLYAYAREGIAMEEPVRLMTVNSVDFMTYDEATHTIHARFDVASGTYIRSIAVEIGKRFGTCATLQELRRISIGDFQVKDAMKIDSSWLN